MTRLKSVLRRYIFKKITLVFEILNLKYNIKLNFKEKELI